MSRIALQLEHGQMRVTLPESVTARLHLEPGQEMSIVDLPDGVRLTKVDPELSRQLKVVDRILSVHAETFRLLADR